MELTKAAIPKEIEDEIHVFEEWIERYVTKEIPDEKFKRFRLQQGIYGQRQKGVHMVRVRIPSGGLNANQLMGLADLAEHYSTGKGHVTTRQDFQFHYVKLPDVPKVMRLLAEIGLTTREACGNTVRNVTACHLAGACPTELFDVTPYCNAISHHLLRNSICQSLPRKFKISFSGCKSSCGLAAIHDIGFIAEKREVLGKTEYGFKVFVGGGLGSHPKLAQLYAEFIPVQEILPLSEAILTVFDREGDRKIRSKARMKFILEKYGLDKFKEMVAKDLDEMKLLGKEYPPLPEVEPRSVSNQSVRNGNGHPSNPAFELFRKTNVSYQPQAEYVAVQIKLPLGDITASQFRALASIVAQYASGDMRNTREQNIILHGVRQENLFELYIELCAIGLGAAGAEKVVDVVACPGSDTCNLGLTSSMGLGKAIGDELSEKLTDYSDMDGIRIRISGCPNSCAQHHVASIGFHGVGKKLYGKLAPHYQLHLGGVVDGERANVGLAKTKIPAKNLPGATMELLRIYREGRQDGENFIAFLDRVGRENVAIQLEPFTQLPEPSVCPEGYQDFGADTDFNLDDLGPGECAGTLIDALEHFLLSGARSVETARLYINKGEDLGEAENWQNEAILFSARGLLIPFGIDSSGEGDILKEFQHKLVEQGIVTERFESFTSELGKMAKVEKTIEGLTVRQQIIEQFVNECKEAYDRLDANFKLGKREEPEATTLETLTGEKKGGKMGNGKQADAILDLKGVACPYNFVRTKLKLEEMDAGQLLEVYLDEGEPINNVPKSVQNEGHKVLETAKITEEHYKVLIEKVE